MTKCPNCGTMMWFEETLGWRDFEVEGRQYQVDASLWYCDGCCREVLVVRLFERQEKMIKLVREWSWVITRQLEPHPPYAKVEVVR